MYHIETFFSERRSTVAYLIVCWNQLLPIDKKYKSESARAHIVSPTLGAHFEDNKF